MPVSTDYIMCPYCGARNFKNKAIGISGLINYSGMHVTVDCDRCGKDFNCDVVVTIQYKTYK